MYIFSNIRTSKVASVSWAGPWLWCGSGAQEPESKAGSWGEYRDSHTVRPRPGHRIFVTFPVLTARAFPLLTPTLLYATQKSCLLQHSYFYTIENASRLLLQHSSGLHLGPDDSDSHQSLRSHLRHWSPCHPDPHDWHRQLTLLSPSWVLTTPVPPSASIFRRNYTRTEDWNQPSVQHCCKLEFPVGARCDSPRPGTLGNLWLIS